MHYCIQKTAVTYFEIKFVGSLSTGRLTDTGRYAHALEQLGMFLGVKFSYGWDTALMVTLVHCTADISKFNPDVPVSIFHVKCKI